ncbi:hypothetical protein NL676_012351 [Syzygium grande]|nr:hypothetical protein NL676_012351 [Syzygium grande]
MLKQSRPDLLEELFELQWEDGESEETLLLPFSDSLEKINVPSESGANSWPSASPTSVIGNNYYVFLSFRGPNTRNGFVDHLYHKLLDVGLPFHPNFMFRDDENLPFGEGIAENLFRAIEYSKPPSVAKQPPSPQPNHTPVAPFLSLFFSVRVAFGHARSKRNQILPGSLGLRQPDKCPSARNRPVTPSAFGIQPPPKLLTLLPFLLVKFEVLRAPVLATDSSPP